MHLNFLNHYFCLTVLPFSKSTEETLDLLLNNYSSIFKISFVLSPVCNRFVNEIKLENGDSFSCGNSELLNTNQILANKLIDYLEGKVAASKTLKTTDTLPNYSSRFIGVLGKILAHFQMIHLTNKCNTQILNELKNSGLEIQTTSSDILNDDNSRARHCCIVIKNTLSFKSTSLSEMLFKTETPAMAVNTLKSLDKLMVYFKSTKFESNLDLLENLHKKFSKILTIQQQLNQNAHLAVVTFANVFQMMEKGKSQFAAIDLVAKKMVDFLNKLILQIENIKSGIIYKQTRAEMTKNLSLGLHEEPLLKTPQNTSNQKIDFVQSPIGAEVIRHFSKGKNNFFKN